MPDRLTKEQRAENMRAIRSSGSKIEKKIGSYLWSAGYRYRKNVKKITGKPDFVFKKHKTVVFCDGEFWHGKDWSKRKTHIHSNRAFWIDKIERNIQRDKIVNDTLTKDGWRVIRFWGDDILKFPEDCVRFFESVIQINSYGCIYRFVYTPTSQLLAAEEAETYETVNKAD